MMMTNKLTPEALRYDKVLMDEIGKALVGPSPLSYFFVGDLAVAAELLLRKCDNTKLLSAIEQYLSITNSEWYGEPDGYWEWFAWATPADHCRVCLMALKGK